MAAAQPASELSLFILGNSKRAKLATMAAAAVLPLPPSTWPAWCEDAAQGCPGPAPRASACRHLLAHACIRARSARSRHSWGAGALDLQSTGPAGE
eukprot:242381-Chlamydomonas_euryale.AAC.1